MDTLFDNRKFPEEMQEKKPESSEKKEKKEKIYLFALLALLIIFAIALFFFLKHKNISLLNPETQISPKPTPVSIEERNQNVKDLDDLVPEKKQEERDKELQFFFN